MLVHRFDVSTDHGPHPDGVFIRFGFVTCRNVFCQPGTDVLRTTVYLAVWSTQCSTTRCLLRDQKKDAVTRGRCEVALQTHMIICLFQMTDKNVAVHDHVVLVIAQVPADPGRW